MNSLFEGKYISRILANKDVLISELVDDFGIQYRDLLNERFDEIKFVIFTCMDNLRVDINRKYSLWIANKIIELFKDNGISDDIYIDDKFKEISGYQIEPLNNRNIFNSIFNSMFVSFNFTFQSKEVFGIFSFDNSLDYNYLSEYARNRNTTPEEFIINNRCDFLRGIGKYPENYTNQMIVDDENYPNYCQFYENVVKKYYSIIDDANKKFKNEIDFYNKLYNFRNNLFTNCYKKLLGELIEYLSDDDRKKVESSNYDLIDIDFLKTFFSFGQGLLDESKFETASIEEKKKMLFSYYGDNEDRKELTQKLIEVRRKYAKEYERQILKLFIIESNCDLDDINLGIDLSIQDYSNFAFFVEDGVSKKDRFLFLNPFSCKDECLDIHLRHELRHSLTSSVRRENGLTIVKTGNTEFIYSGEELIEKKNELYNELITQMSSLDKTRKSYCNGIYILSTEGSSFPKKSSSDYDHMIPEFQKLYGILPKDVLNSQIELNNDNLYKFISSDEIKKIEDGLSDFFTQKIPDDVLDSIKSRSYIY